MAPITTARPFFLDAAQFAHRAEIDERGGRREALFHGRQERVTAGDDLGILILLQERRRLADIARAMIFESVHRFSSPKS